MNTDDVPDGIDESVGTILALNPTLPWSAGLQLHVATDDEVATFLHLGIGFPL